MTVIINKKHYTLEEAKNILVPKHIPKEHWQQFTLALREERERFHPGTCSLGDLEVSVLSAMQEG